jgi:hypothetical protein
VILVFCMQIMSLKAGNANVVLLFTVHDDHSMLILLIIYYYLNSYYIVHLLGSYYMYYAPLYKYQKSKDLIILVIV